MFQELYRCDPQASEMPEEQQMRTLCRNLLKRRVRFTTFYGLGFIGIMLRVDKTQTSYNVALLSTDDIRQKYDLELKNRFQLLQSEDSVDEKWQQFKDTVNEVAQSVLGKRREKRNKRWITPDTWKLIGERRVLKAKRSRV